ncbi:TIGR02281 family clan AA aspartic protease [Shimia thalassica]|jgi:aspartyl protease family protein|uniref:Clan AA aspartic protease n=1 Tax=Shimia thalassica TaxID=1715693 RepID=A0A0P1IEW7_9RHOB|nr:TIGR02281 family clan AA aspartic protease [Shimia thalassica]PHO03899.1 TIGR02281 family clan AA aspartic protease [Rhodobacteraceae bacterium 4F10]MBU2941629.1 TIGR02281 family clan AA aspartic protease [Shimia thalassica]MDO6480699.1 TIGR02281 family clan AA aspartic protease [Shimia thalassica]MDO6483795.1 TIGR02281 family clan AA aspartic protease [Shimia thalassica]MDO6503990.1 TIGR02281 family clan AA aspartic protease [Shimia thalassica]
MNGDQIGEMTYLVVLGAAVVFWFVTSHRQSFGKTIQQLLAWVLIGLGVVAAYGMWDDIRSTVTPTAASFESEGAIEIPRGMDGHYHMTVEVNGAPISFIVDTGASQIVLNKTDARRIGLDPEALPYFGRAMTANGEVRTAPVKLDELRVGGIVDRNVAAQVNEGELSKSLLGMSYLQRFEQVTIAGNKLILKR